MLLKNPGFTVVAVLSLALVIGANSTIFSALNALLYRPLPYKDPDRLVAIWETNLKHGGSRREPPIANAMDWRAQNHVFEDIAMIDREPGTETLTGIGEAVRVAVQGASISVFSLLGVKPGLGRIFLPEELRQHGESVLIGHSFWKRRFDSNPNVLGRAFNMEGS